MLGVDPSAGGSMRELSHEICVASDFEYCDTQPARLRAVAKAIVIVLVFMIMQKYGKNSEIFTTFAINKETDYPDT